MKNQQRFNFGVLYPREYCDLQAGSEAWEMKTECLVLGDASATDRSQSALPADDDASMDWQEGEERDVCMPAAPWNRLRRSLFAGNLRSEGGTSTGELELASVTARRWSVSS